MLRLHSETKTAKQAGQALCHTCHKLQPLPPVDRQFEVRCDRCGDVLHYRKPNSLANSWALLFTGVMCLIPAQIWPVMRVAYLGNDSGDSIMSGVITLLHMGSYLVAIVVFVASVFVPVSKVIAMAYILMTVQFGWSTSQRQRVVLYRILEWVGRWSMLDIFVVAIMAALFDFGGLAKITAGTGATAFALAVIFTMVAAMKFDARLIWDAQEPELQKPVTTETW